MQFETVEEAAKALLETNQKFMQSRAFRFRQTPPEALMHIEELQNIVIALIQLHTIEIKKRLYRNR